MQVGANAMEQARVTSSLVMDTETSALERRHNPLRFQGR